MCFGKSRFNRAMTMSMASVLAFLLFACTIEVSPLSDMTQAEKINGQLFNVEKITCPAFVNLSANSANEVQGGTYECGVVEVPENYAEPNGRSIELIYIRLFSTGETSAPDPLLYLSGGPGGSAMREAAIPNLYSNLQIIRKQRDIVFYDQRGTGLTAPLNCGPSQAVVASAIELLPDIAEDIQALESDAIRSTIYNIAICAKGYTAAGVDLAQYNSIVSTKDMASLMSALGYEQYNLYGTSYGTKLAQVALRETPDRVRSVVMDGTSPVSQPQIANSFIESNEQYVRIFAQCAADPVCNEAYPNLSERFTALLNQLKDTPIVLDDPIIPTGLMTLIIEDDQIDTIDISLLNTLIQVNNSVNNHLWGEQISIAGQIPRIVLALEEGDIEYVRSVFRLPGAGAAPAEEIQTIADERAIMPDNEYIAPTIDALLAEAQKVATLTLSSTPQEQWVGLVINYLATRLQSEEEQTDVVRDLIELTILPTQGRDPQLLIAYANAYLPEETAAQTNTLVVSMTQADIRATMWHINEVAEAMSFSPDGQPGFHEEVTWAVNCAEDVGLRTADVLDEAIAAALYPQLATSDKKEYEFYELACSFFPESTIAPSFIEPVVSDIPTLLLQGDLDAQTPPSQAHTVERHLSNAQFVLFESEGHVVSGKTLSCPGTIAAQFLNDPTGGIDRSCADAFVINFEIPE